MKCFECNSDAEEQHHIIPKVTGGTKTIPLCSSCHSKVHGLGKRRDNHSENVKRGLDKHRKDLLWIVYSVIAENEGFIPNALDAFTYIEKDEQFKFPKNSFSKGLERLKENDSKYWFDFFLGHGYFKRQFESNFLELK